LISKQEVMEFAHELRLAPHIIEKDYVLGWILAGIYQNAGFGKNWVFKGGTCLKKCFFETYRFSEDLDFTLTNTEHIDEPYLKDSFSRIAEWVYDQAGIEIPKDTLRFEIYQNPRGTLSVQGRISYRGPMRKGGDLPRIKLDLTSDEILVLDPVQREIHHPYSDKPGEGFFAYCYSFEEVFAEKIRALGERERPRDLYDVVQIFRHEELRPDKTVVLETLKRKCSFKGIPVPTIESLGKEPERTELGAEWGNMLRHQLPALPPLEQFWEELGEFFNWLLGLVGKIFKPSFPVPVSGIDPSWRPPAMAQAWHGSTSLETIRFAASNRLCVDLLYKGSRRLIEPYSLRRSQEGNFLLFAVKHDIGEDRSYRVDRIEAAEVSKVSFSPRYLVELTPSGPLNTPDLTRPTTGYQKTRIDSQRGHLRSSRTVFSSGPKYIFECPLCRKRFTRISNRPSLNKHSDKNGYPCPGRTGIYISTKY
jgi:predicted nucleotidyltransferase component of viral defense system